MSIQISGSMSVGRMAYAHDRRDTHTKNVDPRLSSKNVTLVDRLAKYDGDVAKYLDDIMQPVIDKYNEGKKPSRRINVPYTQYREQNKNLKGSPLAYEAVMQIGEHDTLGGAYYNAVQRGDKQTEEHLRGIFTEAYKGMLEQLRTDYPHIKVVAAFVHFDEPNGTPHMHLQYVPIGQQDKGLPVQVSIGRALANDGIERIQSRAEAKELGGYQMAKWYKQIREEIIEPAIKKVMQHFPNIEYSIKEEQHGKQHKEPDVFKAYKAAENKLHQAQAELQAIKSSDEFQQAFEINIAREAARQLDESTFKDLAHGAYEATELQLGLVEPDAADGIDDLGIEDR